MESKHECSACTESETLNKISKDLKELKDAMLGTEYMPGGFVRKVMQLEAKVKRLEYKLVFYSGAAVGAGYFLAKILNKVG